MLFYSKTSVEDFHRQTISNPEFWPHIIDLARFTAEPKNELRVRKSREMSLKNYLHREVVQSKQNNGSPNIDIKILKNFMPINFQKVRKKSPTTRIRQSPSLNERDLNESPKIRKYLKPTLFVVEQENKFIDDFLRVDYQAPSKIPSIRREIAVNHRRSASKTKLETSVDKMLNELDNQEIDLNKGTRAVTHRGMISNIKK